MPAPRRRPRRRPAQREEASNYVKHLRSQLPIHHRLEEIVASGDDPHPRKTRRIKWIGDYNPMDDAKVHYNLLHKLYNPFQETAVRRMAAYAKVPSPIQSAIMIAQHERRGMATVEHLGCTYHFTHLNNFTCYVDYRDVDILLRAGNGQFVDLDDPNMKKEHLYTPDEDVWKLISVEVMDRDTTKVPNHLRVAEGP
jgi:hypothetical protein